MEVMTLPRGEIEAASGRIDGEVGWIESYGEKMKLLTPPLAEIIIFHYAHLVPLNDSLIKEMKESGEQDELISKIESKYLSAH